MGGLHSGETGPPEMLMELAYRLAVEDSPLIRRIRESVIVSLTPAAEPDGRDRYVDWYYRHRIDETDERENSGGPPYWGKYIFHDNNRDINYSQVTMRNLLRVVSAVAPADHARPARVGALPLHLQRPGAPEPFPRSHPLRRDAPVLELRDDARWRSTGMPGVWTHAFVDMWSPGYLGFMSSNHNGMVRMYETFGNGGATTMKRTVDPPEGAPGRINRPPREWYRPCLPTRRSSGRCATTRTTCRRGCSRPWSSPRASRG